MPEHVIPAAPLPAFIDTYTREQRQVFQKLEQFEGVLKSIQQHVGLDKCSHVRRGEEHWDMGACTGRDA